MAEQPTPHEVRETQALGGQAVTYCGRCGDPILKDQDSEFLPTSHDRAHSLSHCFDVVVRKTDFKVEEAAKKAKEEAEKESEEEKKQRAKAQEDESKKKTTETIGTPHNREAAKDPTYGSSHAQEEDDDLDDPKAGGKQKKK